VSFRARLLLTALATLVVGVGAVVVAGNVPLGARVRAEASSLLRTRAEAEIAELRVTRSGIRVREPVNDTLTQQSWVLDGNRVVERPPGVSRQKDQTPPELIDEPAGRPGTHPRRPDHQMQVSRQEA
jgi:hypothetical protein